MQVERAGTPGTPGVTYSHQKRIGKLPIPDLKATCNKYLATVKVLLSEAEYKKTEEEVESFLAGAGPTIHNELMEYDKSVENYVQEFWDATYTDYQGPSVINVNPMFLLEDDPTPSRNNQIARASSLILSSLKFVRALRQETLTPDILKNKKPLCMSQFKRIFGSARVPCDTNEGSDMIVNSSTGNHIVLIRRGQFYYFEALSSDWSVAITEREIVKNLKCILADAETMSDEEVAASSVGVLTSEERPVWADLRKRLLTIGENKKIMDVIDSALFVVCLDNTSPSSASENARSILHGLYRVNNEGVQIGTCISRWYDKLQIIVNDNGAAGVNFEHSVVDGHTVLRFASDIFTDTIVRFAQTISGPARVNSFIDTEHVKKLKAAKIASRPNTVPRKLELELDSKLKEAIRFAEVRVSDLINRNETEVLEFTGYGKLYIVSNGMSPDAFVQLAIMTSYYNMYGRIVNTYESVQTKSFKYGRTEAARSASPEALEFMKAFNDPSLPEIDVITKLNVALKTHSMKTREASVGLGCDRLLFAMKALHAKNHPDEPTPALFSDKGWQVLNETILSTSNCGNPSLRLFGFGPVSPDGFGVGYIVKDDSINLCITSKHRQTKRYITSLRTYLCKIQDMLISVNPKTSARMPQRNQTSDGYGFFGTDEDNDVEILPVGKPLM